MKKDKGRLLGRREPPPHPSSSHLATQAPWGGQKKGICGKKHFSQAPGGPPTLCGVCVSTSHLVGPGASVAATPGAVGM